MLRCRGNTRGASYRLLCQRCWNVLSVRVENRGLDDAGAFGDHPVLLRPPVRGEVEHLVLALAAEVEIDVGDDHLVGQLLDLLHYAAIVTDEAGAADHPGAVLLARLRHRDRPGR